MAGTQLSRPASGIAVTLLMGVVTVVTVVSLAATGDAESARRILPGFVAATYLTWMLFWWPALIVRPAGVAVRNPLRTFEIDWRAIEDVETRFSTVLRTPGRTITAWAGPTGRRRPSVIGRRGPVEEPVDGLADRIRADAEVAREDPSAAVPDVVTRWNVPVILGAIAVVAAAVVLALA